MLGQPAVNGAATLRVLLLDGDKSHDVFDVIDLVDGVIRARSPFLLELGEEIRVRIERDGTVSEALARVRAHVGVGDKITELELIT